MGGGNQKRKNTSFPRTNEANTKIKAAEIAAASARGDQGGWGWGEVAVPPPADALLQRYAVLGTRQLALRQNKNAPHTRTHHFFAPLSAAAAAVEPAADRLSTMPG